MLSKKQATAIIKSYFGKNPLECHSFYDASQRIDKICLYHDDFSEEIVDNNNKAAADMESGYSYIDDITWDDLEMDDVFLRINHTDSFAGEQILYHKLHDVSAAGDQEKFEKKQQFLKENEKKRIEIEQNLFAIGKNKNDYYMMSFLKNTDKWKVGNEILMYIMQFLLVFFIVSFACTRLDIMGVGAVLTAFINISIYMRIKQKYEVFFESLGNFKNIYNFARWIVKDETLGDIFADDKTKASVEKLKRMTNAIVSFNTRKQGTMSGDLGSIVAEYLMAVTLIDVAAFNRTMKIIENKQTDVIGLIEFAGDIDAQISVLSYRQSMEGGWCRPEYNSEGISAEQLVHPLLGNPVANDFAVKTRAIITGANASGKSTFMKAAAINMLLAQTINTCTAKSFKASHMYVMTCMSLRDDVLSGESYYFREARYLKRMIDVIDSRNNVLCVVDEILKGTNTHERIAASKAILDYIAKDNCIALIATHDMELTETDLYNKFYFDSTVLNDDIVFDYKIHEGIGGKSNAIALLEILGYPKTIVERARRGAERKVF